MQFPDQSIFENTLLIYDFIRGYCDGDSYLGAYKKDGKIKTDISFIGTKSFLVDLEKFLGISGYIRNKSFGDKINQAFELKYSGAKARKVARLLYENSNIYLDRKYKIYKNFCRFEEESLTAKSSKISRR